MLSLRHGRLSFSASFQSELDIKALRYVYVYVEIENTIHLSFISQRGFKFLLIYFDFADSGDPVSFLSWNSGHGRATESRKPSYRLRMLRVSSKYHFRSDNNGPRPDTTRQRRRKDEESSYPVVGSARWKSSKMSLEFNLARTHAFVVTERKKKRKREG